MIGLKRGTVRLLQYTSKWSKAFENEKKMLSKALNGSVIDIQHIGSTAIPGMIAKPIIDISIGTKSMANSKKLIPILQLLGYEYISEFGGPKIHLFFAKGSDENRTHYIHLMKYNGRIWRNDLLFRDYLRKNKERAQQYVKLKKTLAAKFADDRTIYTSSKAEFIHKTIKMAKLGF